MKKLIAAILVSTLTLVVARAGIGGLPGPATFKLDAITQATPFQKVGGKTNQSATSTNITVVLKSTIGTAAFDSADMLAVLTNSFSTNFPAGSQVGLRGVSLIVVDSTGTNIIFLPFGNVVSLQFDGDVEAETVTEVSSLTTKGPGTSGNVTETVMASATMVYDDSLRTTGDGTHTQFAFKGLFVLKTSENIKSETGKTSIVFQGTGGGTVRGVNTVLTGTITSKAPSPADL